MTMVIQVLRPFDLSASFSFLWCPLILMNMNLIESPLHFSLSLHPSVRLSPLWPASALTRDPYAFRAILSNLAADDELFLSEWIQCVKMKKKKKAGKKKKSSILAHCLKCFPAHGALTIVEIRGKIICNWHFGEHFFLFLSGFPVSY